MTKVLITGVLLLLSFMSCAARCIDQLTTEMHQLTTDNWTEPGNGTREFGVSTAAMTTEFASNRPTTATTAENETSIESITIHFENTSLDNETGFVDVTEGSVSFKQTEYSLDNETLWLPGNMTLADWRACHGMSPDVCYRYRLKLHILNEIISGESNSQLAFITDPDQSGHNDTVDGGILYSEEQLDDIFDALSQTQQSPSQETRRKRKKRNLNNFATHPETKWDMPIIYKFDGTHTDGQKVTIRNAYQHWMDNTCVTFVEKPKDAQITQNHVLVSSSGSGCYGYVGKVSVIPQQMNLAGACLYRFGTPVHEIGHSLGLWHEQMRVDRDDWITLVWDNIFASYLSQFSTTYQTDSLGVPYDLGSVMQYSSTDGVSINGKDTMLAKEPLYQQNMGQRVGLSFNDIKIINLGYCKNVCSNQLKTPCLRGGYQNPKDCARCVCPDGFTGPSCDALAPAVNAVCGGEIKLNPGQQQVIKSPGYDDQKHYNAHQECNWWIKAPVGQKIHLNFNGDFGLYCESNSCYHWIEIKYKKDLGLSGGRFCCYQLPKAMVVSDSNEMMLVFRSNFTAPNSAQRGFQATLSIASIARDAVISLDKYRMALEAESAAHPDRFQVSMETTVMKPLSTIETSHAVMTTDTSHPAMTKDTLHAAMTKDTSHVATTTDTSHVAMTTNTSPEFATLKSILSKSLNH